MKKKRARTGKLMSAIAPAFALVALLGIAAYAMLGPTGILAWTDYKAALGQRNEELRELKEQRAALKNKVRLLDPDNVDPDLGGEMIRKELGVVAPDEVVVPLD